MALAGPIRKNGRLARANSDDDLREDESLLRLKLGERHRQQVDIFSDRRRYGEVNDAVDNNA